MLQRLQAKRPVLSVRATMLLWLVVAVIGIVMYTISSHMKFGSLAWWSCYAVSVVSVLCAHTARMAPRVYQPPAGDLARIMGPCRSLPDQFPR